MTEPRVNKRPYDASRRRRQAEENRTRILSVARRWFLDQGYASTSLARIADEAGVSVETIQKGFGGKAGLVRALVEQALQGAGAVPAERRSDAMRVSERDPRRVIDRWGGFVAEVAPLVAPILLLARTAAATDRELAGVLAQVDAARLARMELNAADLLDRGALRPGLALTAARDVLWTYSSPELYELLVIRRGWSVEVYSRFVAEGMMAALLPPEG